MSANCDIYTSATDTQPLMSARTRLLIGDVRLRLVVVGKSGSGKSTLCNHLAGKDGLFLVGHGLNTVTLDCHEESINDNLTVVDTPDEMDKVVRTQKQHIHSAHCKMAIVLCVRADARYAVEEHKIYRELKDLWNDNADFCQRLVIAFTHGDKRESWARSDRPVAATLETELDHMPQLKSVVRDAHNRYVVFGNKVGNIEEEAVNDLLAKVRSMSSVPGTPEADKKSSTPAARWWWPCSWHLVKESWEKLPPPSKCIAITLASVLGLMFGYFVIICITRGLAEFLTSIFPIVDGWKY